MPSIPGTVVRKLWLALSLVLTLSVLAACDTAEERAEKHFQSAMALLEEGDQERAIIEFRNVFQLNGQHYGARSAYANLQRERGNYREAIGQYLRLVEQYPDDVPGNRALAEMNAEIGNWPQMERFLEPVLAAQPDDLVVQSLQVISQYRNAVEGRDPVLAQQAVERAQALRQDLPDYIMLRQVIIDNLIRKEKFEAALKELDGAIEIAPDNRSLYSVRLSVLGALGDAFEIEEQLKLMIERFPDDESSRVTLVRWYVSQLQLDEAEQYLRDAIDPESDDPAAKLTLLRFLSELRSPEVALAEVNRMIDEGDDLPILMSLRAGLRYETGDVQGGLAEMKALVESLEANDETRQIRVAYARMLIATGDEAGGRQQVEEILAQDASEVEALKLKAAWLIEEDQVGDAIVALRTALDQKPRDPEIMTLLARAHERDGNKELVGEMLSLAAEVSNNGAEESIRYAQYLGAVNKLDAAEAILIEALRVAPAHVGLLSELGDVYIAMKEWDQVDRVISTLNGLPMPEAKQAVNALTARSLQGQQKITEAVGFLEELLSTGEAGIDANIAIVRAYMAQGEFEKAKQHLQDVLAADPQNMGVRFMDATVDAATGNVTAAEASFRAMLAEDNTAAHVWVALYRLLLAEGRNDEAVAVVDQAQAVLPDDPTLRWIRAGLLENAGDIDGAVAIYEKMYAEDSNNPIIANNLASLLSATNPNAETIERAYKIARRLRLSQVPPYQDTYGWLSYLRGNFEDARQALEPAARSLADDPVVQFHLAQTYAALEEFDLATTQYKRVLQMVDEDDDREFVATTRAEIERLSTLPRTGSDE